MLWRRVFTISGWTLVSRILGLVRDRLWAGAQGGSLMLDCFLVAFQLPNLLRNLFGEGALSAAFIPRYVQARERSPEEAELFAGLVLTRLTIALSALAVVGMAACVVALLLGSGRTAIVAALALPMVPYLVFVCVAAIMGGVLHGRRHFWAPACAPVLLNLSLIATVGLELDEECWYLPYAVLGGGIASLFLHLAALASSGGVPPGRWRVPTPAIGERLRELLRAYLPTVFASGVHQINAWLDAVIAMAFVAGNGAVAVLYFANRLLQFPLAMIGHGVATAAYPELASAALEGWRRTVAWLRPALAALWYWLLPAALGLAAVAEPLVRAIYQVGQFDERLVERTVLATRLYALALIPQACTRLLMRAFHAHREQATPVRISLWMIVANLLLNLALVQTPLAEAGIALAAAISAAFGCGLYLRALRGHAAPLPLAWRECRRPLLAALAMAAAVLALLQLWPQPAGGGSAIAALRLAVVVVVGALLYIVLAGRPPTLPARRSEAAADD
ncbi:MAG: murein biosynthesis integral membrane protein MurJ [Planctomycetota bacterium]|nr:murein biosynthesis integral membrane protein MurJ [Planctomycetota bacterium]MCX8039169.1 murein biosynthesis integral membrane protein MurJ [Planctomycetota bacterium]MDW8373530.1 murein biosynthesis integral membrane protein MurJ [Planctomycetota bacterium]